MGAYPTTPEAVSADWLSAQLGKEVTELEVKAFGEGSGIIGQVTRARFVSNGANDSVIIKFPSAAPENRGVAMHYNMYGREVDFYRDYAAAIPIRVPRAWAVEFDPESHDFVLVLEDLQGYRLGDQVAGATLADARSAVAAIAAMHAATWNVDLPGLVSHNNPAQAEGMIGGFGVGWSVVLEKFAAVIPKVAADKGGALPDHVVRLLAEMSSGPQVLVHADVRLDNMFFAADQSTTDQSTLNQSTGAKDPLALIDWQSVCSSCGEQDLAYFLTQSLPSELLRAEGAQLIELYHQTLCAAGVEGYTLDQCKERYRTSALYLMCYAVVIAGTLDLGNERGQALGAALLGRSLSALADLDAFELLV